MFLIFSFSSPMSNHPLPSYIMSPDDESSHPNLQLVYLLNSPLQIKAQISPLPLSAKLQEPFHLPQLLLVLSSFVMLFSNRSWELMVILNPFVLACQFLSDHPPSSVFSHQENVSDAFILLLLLSFS